MTTSHDDARFITLEVKLAEQEDTLRVLDQVVTVQALLIDQLQARTLQLAERLSALARDGASRGASGGSLADEVPPHY